MRPLCQKNARQSEEGERTECQTEAGSFSNDVHSADALRVVAFNINYNGLGGEGDPKKQANGLDGIEILLRKIGADVVLLSEVSRDCDEYGNGAEELAKRLEMSWAYVVEFVDTKNTTYECSTGNAILSKSNLSHVQDLRFENTCCMYPNRIGGRSSIAATIDLPGGIKACLHSTHLESGTEDEVARAILIRAQQAEELGNFANEFARRHRCEFSIIGGDMNAPFRQADPTLLAFSYRGFHDAHRHLSPHIRTTVEGGTGGDHIAKYGLGVLDYILVQPASRIELHQSGVCHAPKECHGFSDHVAIWTDVRVTGQSPGMVDTGRNSTLDSLLRGADTPANWVWLSLCLVVPFLVLHGFFVLVAARKRERTSGRERAERVLSLLEKRRLLIALMLVLCVLACPFGLVDNRQLVVRDAGFWLAAMGILWCTFVFHVTQCQASRPSSPVTIKQLYSIVYGLDVLMVSSWFSSAVFWSLTFPPRCHAQASTCLPEWSSATSQLIVNLVLPILWFLLGVPRDHTSEESSDGTLWPGVTFLSTVFFAFFWFVDWLLFGCLVDWGTNPNGWVIVSPDTILSALLWGVLLGLQCAFIFCLGKARLYLSYWLRRKQGEPAYSPQKENATIVAL